MTDLRVKKGTDGGYRWLVRNKTTHAPLDFTGWTVKAQIRELYRSSILHEWSTELGTAFADAEGQVTLTFSAAITTTWAWRFGLYDVELYSPTNRVTRLDSGRIEAVPEVTR